MLKRSLAMVLCLVLLSPLNVYAAEPRYANSRLTLDFDGTTALCGFSITNIGKHIEFTVELWWGNTLVDSWTKEGDHMLSMDETCPVVSGRTYTLTITGVCGTEPISCTPVSKQCP